MAEAQKNTDIKAKGEEGAKDGEGKLFLGKYKSEEAAVEGLTNL